MRRTHQALITLALGLALVTATTAARATPPTGTQDQADRRSSRLQLSFKAATVPRRILTRRIGAKSREDGTQQNQFAQQIPAVSR
jgi:hypothetical protein